MSGLDLSIVELAADEVLRVEDGVDGVHGDLVLRCVTDETLGAGEGVIGWVGAITLVVGVISTRLCCQATTQECRPLLRGFEGA